MIHAETLSSTQHIGILISLHIELATNAATTSCDGRSTGATSSQKWL